MGRAVVRKTEKGACISCIRGPLANMHIIVRNRKGEEFYSMFDEVTFKILSSRRTIDVYEKNNLAHRRFVREFLEFVSVFPVDSAVTAPTTKVMGFHES